MSKNDGGNRNGNWNSCVCDQRGPAGHKRDWDRQRGAAGEERENGEISVSGGAVT